jgi:DNA-binding transcriptional MerR regulator
VKNVLSLDYSLFIGLLSSTLSKLNELGEQGRRLSGSKRDEAISLIQELKSKGFKNRDIAVMTGRRWSEATVKKYTTGVKIVSTEERDKVLETFSTFVKEGKTIQEVEDYLERDKYLNSIGLTFEDIGTLISKNREAGGLHLLVDLYSQIAESKYSVQD